MLERRGREIFEYIQAIKARPIVATPVDVTIPADWRELELHAQAIQPRLTNGGQR
jgi:hypothetical protein